MNMHSGNPTAAIEPSALDASIASATEALLGYRQADGHWVFELESDATIPAEYVLLRHYLGEPVDAVLEAKIANYLRRVQGAHGGWPLVHDGAFDMSASVKSYFALKMIGDSVDAPHMVRARDAIRSRGGAIHSNVFTRFMLAMFGVLTWRSVPVLPVEIMLLPLWSPFHINKISYWARTTIVPLMVLAALKPRAKNVSGVGIDELFLQKPHSIGMTAKAPHQSRGWFLLFRVLDSVLRLIEPLFPKSLRARAIERAVAFIEERLNGEDGLGAIYPPMANAVMMYEVLGKPADYPPRAVTRKAIDRLLVIGEHEAYCQPCVSPVWDTALTCHALLEAGGEAVPKAKQGLDWLKPKQVLDLKGDWAVKRPDARPGGWAFQYNNDYYPDLDDTAVVVMAMRDRPRPRMDRGHAEPRRRLGRLRRRQPRILPQQHSILRSRCAARSADRGRHRALRLDAGATRRNRPTQQNGRGRCCVSAPHPARGRVVVWPLGPELHLRHLVGAVRTQCRGCRARRPDVSESGRVAAVDPEQRRRLGRGCRQLSTRL